VLRWSRDLAKHRHTRTSPRPGPARTLASIRRLVLRLAADNSCWGYRRIPGELAPPGITMAPSTVGDIVQAAGIDPAPHRATIPWAAFLRSQTRRCWPWTSSRPSPCLDSATTTSP
jgi:hypothetical protein